jgi:hypothetical protein
MYLCALLYQMVRRLFASILDIVLRREKRVERMRSRETEVPDARPTTDVKKKTRKGDPTLLGDKASVSYPVAQEYLGISDRQRQRLIKDKVLDVVGQRPNCRITTDSLRQYHPPNDAT